jgi:hypothetical protein
MSDVLSNEARRIFVSELILEMLEAKARRRPGAAAVHKRFVDYVEPQSPISQSPRAGEERDAIREGTDTCDRSNA